MSNFYTDNEDLQYYFRDGVDWKALIRTTEFEREGCDSEEAVSEAVETYQEMLTMIGTFASDEIASRAANIDRGEISVHEGAVSVPKELDEIFEQLKALDLHWMCIPRELGGMNVPLLVYFMTAEVFARADVSVMTHHSFHGGMALAMRAYSIKEGTTTFDFDKREITGTRFADFIEEIGNGDAWGTMDITEPDAGSDMAALRTSAEQDDSGNWFVTGQKIFITSGHGKYHFVIARTEKSDGEDPFAGLAGLSFFLVPAYEDLPDGTRKHLATVDRVEEKLGHHGSVTASISFDQTPAMLIGNRGEGFKYMLTLMNNARLGVGFESIGLCEAATRLAREYAEQRPSMGKTIDQHEMIADYLDEMESDIQGLRALAITAAIDEETATKLSLMLEAAPDGANRVGELDLDALRRRVRGLKARARKLTPLLKYSAAERAVAHARRCVQIHGGNGYTKEYGAEKLLRDALVLPIYEGTSQIQSLMAMKDALNGVIANPQDFVRSIAQARWRTMSARDPLERRVAKLELAELETIQLMMRKTATDKLKLLKGVPMQRWGATFLKDWNPKRDFAFAMLHAERLTLIMTDVAISKILLAQAKQHEERREVLDRYLDRAEPRVRSLKDEISTRSLRILERLNKNTNADPSTGETEAPTAEAAQ